MILERQQFRVEECTKERSSCGIGLGQGSLVLLLGVTIAMFSAFPLRNSFSSQRAVQEHNLMVQTLVAIVLG